MNKPLYDPTIPRRRLLLLRKHMRFTQKQFAVMMNTSYRRYQRLEYGELDLCISDIYKISSELGISPSLFFVDDLGLINTFVPKPPLDKHHEDLLLYFLTKNVQTLATKTSEIGTISELYCDQCWVADSFADHFNLSIKGNCFWGKTAFTKCNIVGYFDSILRVGKGLFMSAGRFDNGIEGIRHSISVAKIIKKSWDNPKSITISLNVTDIKEKFSYDLAEICSKVERLSNQKLTFIGARQVEVRSKN